MNKFLFTSVLGGLIAGAATAQTFPGKFQPANKGPFVIPQNVRPQTLPIINNNQIRPLLPVINNQTRPFTPVISNSPLRPLLPINNTQPGNNQLKPLLNIVNTQLKPFISTTVPQSKPLGGLTSGKQDVRFVLPQSINNQLGQLSNSGKLDPLSQTSLANAMAGQSLSDQDRLLLTGQMLNPKLSASEKAAIAKALQEDLKEKQQMVVPPTTPIVIQPPVVIPQQIVVPPSPPVVVTPPETVVVTPPTTPTTPTTPMGGSDIDETTSTKEYGLKITQVGATGAAATAGLKAGDIIVMVAGQRVQSFDEMAKLLRDATSEVEVMYYNAEGKLQSLKVTPKEGKLGVAADAIALN